MWTNKVKKCAVRKIIFCSGLTRAAKAGQKSIVPARQTQRTNQGRIPYICTPRVPIHLSFNSQQGQPLSNLSGRTDQESPFTSVSTVSRGHPSLISLAAQIMVGIFYVICKFSGRNWRVKPEARIGTEFRRKKYLKNWFVQTSIFWNLRLPRCVVGGGLGGGGGGGWGHTVSKHKLLRIFFREILGTKFRKFASIFVPRSRIPSCFLFHQMLRHKISKVCLYFCSTRRNSELFFLPWIAPESNLVRLLLFLFNVTEFRAFCLFRGIVRNEIPRVFFTRWSAGIPSKITICFVYSVSHVTFFCQKWILLTLKESVRLAAKMSLHGRKHLNVLSGLPIHSSNSVLLKNHLNLTARG